MRTTSSFKFVGVLTLPKNLFPIVGAGKMPAFTKAAAFPSTNGSLLALKGWKTGWVVATAGFTLFGLVESALQDTPVGVISGVLKVCPAFVKRACCAGEI